MTRRRATVKHLPSPRERWAKSRKRALLRRRLHKRNVRSRAEMGAFGNQYALLDDTFGRGGAKRLRTLYKRLTT